MQRIVLRWFVLLGLTSLVGCQARPGRAPAPSPAPASATPEAVPQTAKAPTVASARGDAESIEAPEDRGIDVDVDADVDEESVPAAPLRRAERHGAWIEVDPPPAQRAPYDDGLRYRAEPLPESYGCSGFGQVGLRPTSFASLTAERDFMDSEVQRESRDIRDLRGCLREWDAKIRAVREATPVNRARLAELRGFRQKTVDAIAGAKSRRARYRARRDEIQAELDRRRRLIESGICPSEPCPPGTRLADPLARPVRE